MKILYIRCSTIGQNVDRQKLPDEDFDIEIIDQVSGSLDFFEREGGAKIKELVDSGAVKMITVEAVDRVGRSLRDILNTLHYFNEKKVPVKFLKEGIVTLDEELNESPVASLLINTMGSIAQLTRELMLQRQAEGILIRKSLGLYTGRKPNTTESVDKFLSKRKNKEALNLLTKGMKPGHVAKVVGLCPNTITKIKKFGEIQ